MLRFLVLSILMACAFGNVVLPRTLPLQDGRIVGGESANIEDFPHQVTVRFNAGILSYFCGGSKINGWYILTAAHCCISIFAFLYTVEYGTTKMGSGTIVDAAQIKRHKDYNANTFDYDICIVRVAKYIPDSSKSKPIPPAIEQPIENNMVNVTGYGVTTPDGSLSETLRRVELPIVSKSKCNETYAGKITDNMICAGYSDGGKDSCQGDSGSALVFNGSQAGIVSWGDGCAKKDTPGVYTDVSKFFSWIIEHSKY